MNIVVATDFSDNSRAALRWGALLARQLGSDLTVVHVVDLAAGDNAWRILVETPDELERSAVVEAEKKLESFVDEVVDQRPDDVAFRAVLGTPVEQLLEEAKTFDDPIVVAGTRGRSRLKELLLGNTARRLVRKSAYPTVLVPPKAMVSTPKKLVAGIDFSEASREALRRAAMMARTYDASIDVVYGYVLPEVATLDGSMASVATAHDDLISEKEEALASMVREVEADDVVGEISALQLPPAQAILSTADQKGAQFIFVGTHGRRGVARFFLGNTAERVIRKAPCPLFVVPAPEREDDAE